MPRTKAAPNPIKPFLADLEHDDYRMRRNAIQQLAKTRNPQARPYLIAMLNDPVASVRQNAISALTKFRDTSVIEPLLQQLKHESLHVRNAASKELMMYAEEAVPALLTALTDEDRYLRAGAATLLGKLRVEAAFAPLSQCVTDPSPYVLIAVCNALVTFKDRCVIDLLWTVANRDPASITSELVHHVGIFTHKHAQQVALNHLTQQGKMDAFQRMINDYRGLFSVINTLHGLAYKAKHGDAMARTMLDWCAGHPSPKVRRAVEIAIEKNDLHPVESDV